MLRSKRCLTILLCTTVAAAAMLSPRSAAARVRLENICSIYGQEEIQLTGLGLVVGLNGTGDNRSLPTKRALAASLKLLNAPISSGDELRDAKNVAIVMIEATIPKAGLRRGQKIDCYVSSIFGAKSLRGGRLLVTPVETADIGNDKAVGVASGAVYIEDEDVPTTGLIPAGVALLEDFVSHFIDKSRGDLITLLLDEHHSSFPAASEIARIINDDFSHGSPRQLAKAVAPGVVEVRLAEEYHDAPVDFVAEVLAVRIDNPHTQARVVVNTKTKTVVVTGEVEISPVTITHPRLTVQVGGPAGAGGGTAGNFVALQPEGSLRQQQLDQLVAALDELRVPPADIVDIIRELHRSGKLHAAYEER